MPSVMDENYILNRRFVRACELIISDETIPFSEYEKRHIPAKYSQSGDYRVCKFSIPLEGNKDAVNVETKGYSFVKTHACDYDIEWLYMFDNDMVGSPWLHGFKIPTNYVSYFDVKPPRRASAGRYHLEDSVSLMEDDILKRMSMKPREELTDKELLDELHMLIGNIVGLESSFYTNSYDGFGIYHQGMEYLDAPVSETEAHHYLLLSEYYKPLEVLSKKNELKIITKMNDDFTYVVADSFDEIELKNKVMNYLHILRGIKQENDKHMIAIENAFAKKPKEKIKTNEKN